MFLIKINSCLDIKYLEECKCLKQSVIFMLILNIWKKESMRLQSIINDLKIVVIARLFPFKTFYLLITNTVYISSL